MNVIQFPALQLSFSRKGTLWRKSCVDFADSQLHFNYALVRNTLQHMKINYDLLNGKIHMDDLLLLCNPDSLKAEFIPKSIQHYPIINSKLNVLKGEEYKRLFDYRVVVTNPNAISEIEETKKQELFLSLLNVIKDESLSLDEFNQKLDKLNTYYTYQYLDLREVRANYLLNHYNKEYNMPLIFNNGFIDAMAIGEEIYQTDIIGGEPTLVLLNPRKLRLFMSGYSNRIEDADMIVYEDFYSPGRIYDEYYDSLTSKDIKKIEEITEKFSQGAIDSMDNIDERYGFVNTNMISDVMNNGGLFFDPFGEYSDSISNELMPYDYNGNIRVLKVYWKSRKKIKKIKYYNEKGEEEFTFMAENYIADEYKGEEEESFWINEAWEGTKIGNDIYVNIRPRLVLYNTLNNPSRCHFGIIGSIYNINESKPFSMVDMMKPYSYLYDIIHDRLNKMMARNWGKMTRLDLSKKPKSWKMDKWLYYAKTMGLFVEDSFNEGNIGAATGKLAGALNSNSQGVIDADFGNNILQYINLLEFIKMEMSDIIGISKQREGLVSNRETVGGVERATLQSSHITEWVFTIHDDIKRRVLTAFLETAKIALRGRTKKFNYILPDNSIKMIEIDGDEFAENDYGIVVDNSNGLLELNQKLDTLALAALLNQTLSFSTIMKLYTSASVAEKQRYIEDDELRIQQLKQQEMQQQQLMQLQLILALLLQKQAEMQLLDSMNLRDNETKILVAEINSLAEMAVLELKNHMTEMDEVIDALSEPEEYSQEAKDKLMELMKVNDAKIQADTLRLQLERDKFEFEKLKHREDNELKDKISQRLANRAKGN